MKPWVIYVLKHPLTLEVRYVGKTLQTLRARLVYHTSEARRIQDTFKQRWVLAVKLKTGLDPIIEQIDAGFGDGWKSAEKRWIALYRAQGARLTNTTDGGEGVVGLTPEQLSARSRKANASRSPEQRRANMLLAYAAWRENSTHEQRSAFRQKQIANTTPEQRSAAARQAGLKSAAKLTPEQRSEKARHANANMTQEQSTARGRIAGKASGAARRAAAVQRYKAHSVLPSCASCT